MKTFHLKDNNVEIWMEVIIVTFLYAVETVDVLNGKHYRRKSCRNPMCTFCMTMKSSCRINKLNRDFWYWQILSLVCPLKYHVT